MKKLISISLVCVFAMSFFAGFVATESDAAVIKCKATCLDGYTYVCCKVGKGNKWDCFFDYNSPCGPVIPG